MEYQFKTKPFKHQLDTFEMSKDKKEYAIFWEQGTGKTKLTIDTISYLYLSGQIDAVIIVAPNNVHRNWVTDEIPAHAPDRVFKVSKMLCWSAAKANNVSFKKEFDELLAHQGLPWLTIAYDAFTTDNAKKAIWKFLKKRRVFYVADEAHRIKAPGAKRTKSILASSKYAPYKRILTGTPIANGPFDVYSQMKFLDENFWKQHQLDSFVMFKNIFGNWQRGFDGGPNTPRYDVLLGYQNLERLNKIIAESSSRVTKDEVLDLPPKLYSKRYCEMNKEQIRVYQELRDQYMTELMNGDIVTATLPIVRLLRYQQVTCGYMPTEGDDENAEPHIMLGPNNPRLELLGEICEGLPHKTMIWARFRKDIDMIMDMLGKKAVRYDGALDEDGLEESKDRFRNDPSVQFHVGNPAKGSEGLTYTMAKTVIYYNNSFKLLDRLQSEDRCHRIGQTDQVNYIDLQALMSGNQTVDHRITNNLVNKVEIAAAITGDQMKEWI